jgi:uncharacterized protein YdeI (YjbR/CyaY-like superfamily)
LLGFFKKSSGRAGITYQEALDEALCFGWIDGVRKSIDDARYTIRFTPRKPKSAWSLVNIKRIEELKKLGRVAPPGLAAFEGRDREKSGTYSYETRPQQLDAVYEAKFKENEKAWDFFQAQPPGYRRLASWYVLSAKKEATRWSRLARLVEESEKGRRIGIVTGAAKKPE